MRFGLILLAIPALATAQGSGAFFGVVRGADRQPIPGVEVAIVELSKNSFTDAAGAFRLADITPGLRVVTIRRIGFAIQTDTITFAADMNLEVSYVLVRVPTLDTIAVTDRVLTDFEDNRRLGLGHPHTGRDRQDGWPADREPPCSATERWGFSRPWEGGVHSHEPGKAGRQRVVPTGKCGFNP